jgi:hypothetical protein
MVPFIGTRRKYLDSVVRGHSHVFSRGSLFHSNLCSIQQFLWGFILFL